MPTSPGWAIRASTAATGTTDLTLPLPTGTVDNDILIAGIAHKGTDWAVWPAGWTLVEREISPTGLIRGELYWKRASSEPASWSVTGLASSASGGVLCYEGGLLAGSVVHLSSKQASVAASRQGAPSLTTTLPHLLLVNVFAASTNQSLTTMRARTGLLAPEQSYDPQLNDQLHRINVGTASGGGSRIAMGHWMKTVPGPTGDTESSVIVTGEHVTLFAAFLPETAASAGTRYYLASKYPVPHFYGHYGGSWNSTSESPRGNEIQDSLWELSQLRADAGLLAHSAQADNLVGQSILYHRFCTPPLDAQTISGTFDLTTFTSGGWIGGVQTPSDVTLAEVVYKIHVYITEGNSTAVRHTLLDNYIDPVANRFTQASATHRGLAAPQTLTAGAALDGDRVMVEIGCYLVSSPTPPPNLPPDEWTFINMQHGAYGTSAGATGDLGIPQLDATAGSGNGFLTPHLDFSHTFVEQAYAGVIPTNLTCATAIPIPSIPYLSPSLDTSHAPSGSRVVWYSWTPTASQRVFIHLFGTAYRTTLEVFQGVCGSLTTTIDLQGGGTAHTFTSRQTRTFDAVLGTTYFFRIRSAIGFEDSATASGGELHLALLPYLPPQTDDLFLPTAGYVLCYREGTLINIHTGFAGSPVSGVAIDYTKRPMDDLNGGIHDKNRLYVGLFSGIVEILDIATLNVGENEVDFIFDALGPLNAALASIAINADGTLVVGWFGDGFRRAAGSNGSSWQDRPSSLAASALNVLDATFGDNQAGAPWPAATLYGPTLEAGGTNYLEFDPDEADETLLAYLSSDWYFPAFGGLTIRRINTSTGIQPDNFATLLPNAAPTPSLKGLFPLPNDGGMLVCLGNQVIRLSEAGAVVQTYTPTPALRSQSLADVEITNDATAFWVLDELSTSLFKFDIESGVQLNDVWTQCGFGSCTSIVVYRTEAFPPAPPPAPAIAAGCPVAFPVDLGTGRPGCADTIPVEEVDLEE